MCSLLLLTLQIPLSTCNHGYLVLIYGNGMPAHCPARACSGNNWPRVPVAPTHLCRRYLVFHVMRVHGMLNPCLLVGVWVVFVWQHCCQVCPCGVSVLLPQEPWGWGQS